MIKQFNAILSNIGKTKMQPMCFSCKNTECNKRINNSKQDKCFENGRALYCDDYK